MTESNKDLNSIFGTLYALEILGNTTAFKNWLAIEHNIHETEFEKELFEGYKYSIETLIRLLIDSILLEYSLEIKTDFLFERACFEGINIEKIPVTCEKRKIIQKINSELENIEKSKVTDFEKKINSFKKVIIEPFKEIYDKYVEPIDEWGSKQNALTRCSIHMAHIYLTNCEGMEPYGYYVVILNRNYRDPTFLLNGYKYSIQYLWAVLLETEYEKTIAKEIHKATQWAISFEDYCEQEKTESITIDSFFGKLSDEIFQQKNEIFQPFFQMKEKTHDYYRILKKLESNSCPTQKLTLDEKTDQFLLWYKVELGNSSKMDIFNGVNTFCQSLIGSIELKKRLKNNDKTIIRKFVHPNERTKGNDYSYAILIESRGTFSDYSGWLLFFDSCTDYSGLGSSEHAFAEFIIKEYENHIELEEMEIPKYELHRITFKKRTMSHVETQEFEEYYEEISQNYDRLQKLEKKLYNAKGILNELLTYYIISRKYVHIDHLTLKDKDFFEKLYHTDIDWNKIIKAKELDVFTESESEIEIIESKSKAENIDLKKEIEKAINKKISIQKDKTAQVTFSFYEKPMKREIFETLKENNIDYLIIRDELKRIGKKTDKLDQIFR